MRYTVQDARAVRDENNIDADILAIQKAPRDQMTTLIKKMHHEQKKALKKADGAVERTTTTTVPKPSARRDRS
eukprot:3911035-Prymnesium_polylepis.1